MLFDELAARSTLSPMGTRNMLSAALASFTGTCNNVKGRKKERKSGFRPRKCFYQEELGIQDRLCWSSRLEQQTLNFSG